VPPFLNTVCIYCKKPNRFDLVELRKEDGVLYKGTVYRDMQDEEEFYVTCQHCGRKFKIVVPRRQDGEEKSPPKK
jgi:hypothetical protein